MCQRVLNGTTLLVEGFEYEVAVEATHVMEQGDDFAWPLIPFHFCKVFQGLEEVLDGITMKDLVILFRRPAD